MRCLIFSLRTSESQNTEARGVFLFTSHFSITKYCSMQCLFLSLHTSVSQSSAACGVFFVHFTLQYHKVPQHAVSFFCHFTLQYHKLAQCGDYVSHFTVPEHAVSFFCHFTHQYHKAAQHIYAVMFSLRTSVSQRSEACGVFFTTPHFSITKYRSMRCLFFRMRCLFFH